MERINYGRVVLGGIVAGIVNNLLGFVVDGAILGPQWVAALKALGKPAFSVSQIVAFNAIGLAYGVFMVWLYAVIRPRYGPGPKTAALAGFAAWIVGLLLPNIATMGVTGLFPANLTGMTTAGGAVESVIGALAGAVLYKDNTASARSLRA